MRNTLVSALAMAIALIQAGSLTAQQVDSSPKAISDSIPAPIWPVLGPEPLEGSILPNKRIVAYYGNPLSRQMGILGEIAPDKMIARLQEEVEAWHKADSLTQVQPALHLVTVVAQADSGRDGKYRALMRDTLIERVYSWATANNSLLFLDIQAGLSTVQNEVPRIEKFLKRPDVHLGLDPEFAMRDGTPPGKKIGTLDADDINDVVDYLANLVTEHQLPPKVLVIHRFTKNMVTGFDRIRLDPRVQIVMHMDGWGQPRLKRDTYRSWIWAKPVQFTGIKIFYKNDTRRGSVLMTPADILELNPVPLYIQYQ